MENDGTMGNAHLIPATALRAVDRGLDVIHPPFETGRSSSPKGNEGGTILRDELVGIMSAARPNAVAVPA
jgi:hypothetical protein